MNCQTAQQTLELARPDHPEGAAIDEAAQHVKGCPSCRTAVRRHEQLDQRIGEVCRDVPVPAGLKERLLAAVEAAAHLDDGIMCGAAGAARVANAAQTGKVAIGTRRRWLGRISLAAACVVAAAIGIWSIWPKAPSIDLDEMASLVATDNIGPENLAEFTHFGNGWLPHVPSTMITRMLVDPPRRLENDVALYFFKVPGARRTTILNGRLLVIPKRLVNLSDVPTAASFLAGPTVYKAGYCTTAWVEGEFVYVCCLSGENELPRLIPRGAAAI